MNWYFEKKMNCLFCKCGSWPQFTAIEFDSFCENFIRGPMEMVEMNHYFQCSAETKVLCKPEDFFISPNGIVGFVGFRV